MLRGLYILLILLTDSEVMTGKSQTETLALLYWPCHSEVNTSRWVWDFPVMTKWMRLIIYLSYGLFLDKYEKLWIQACDQLKPITGQRITLKNSHLNEVYIWAHYTVMWHWSADTLFTICQLIIKWMSTIKLKTDGTLYLPWTNS